ncbi:DNA glycosylase [Boletus coccyginus]|nr:DNA glycosylase [Boletus coccyginus]
MRLTRLAAKASPYHHAVMLYEAGLPDSEGLAGPSTPRRSHRIKQDPDAEVPELDVQSDTEQPRTVSKKKTEEPSLRRKSVRTDADVPDSDGPSPKKRARLTSKPKPRAVLQSLDVPHPAPARWADAYAAIKAMRSRVVAPVDTMGCDQAQLRERDPKNQRFATLVSLMLSSQTKDEVTDAAVGKLRTALGGSLSVQAMLEADDTVISDAIAKVGFWRRKTQYIKQTARRLHDDFDDDVPKTVDELCSLPGVGPKMAFLALQVAWKLNVGIGVDVHVHRITNRLGWHARQTKNPEETRLNLESWLPKALHGEINHVLVGFGQTICLPIGPKCGDCTLSTAGLCPSAQSTRSRTKTPKTAAAAATPRKRSKSSEGDVKGDAGPKVEIEMEPPADEKRVDIPSR